MLQQTQVRVVIPYFQRFVATLPNLPALAAAPEDQILALWSGLGYYARARNLHAAARRCLERYGDDLPRDLDALLALPGIGRSTAGAILAQVWGERFPILDGNVKRILARYHAIDGWPGAPETEKRLWQLAERHLPRARLADYTQAQMDFGATLCTRRAPACAICPLQPDCQALRQGRSHELPTPKTGKSLPQREAVVLLLHDRRGRTLLCKRPPVGVWASLWSLPEQPNTDAARAWFDHHIQADFDSAQTLPPILHVFSHYRLRLQPLRIDAARLRTGISEKTGLRWSSRQELTTLGIPAPVRKLLQTL